MSPKNEIAKRITEFFEFIGIDPLAGTTLLGIIFSALTIKDLKKWSDLSSFHFTALNLK
jgi:hypothetical protein